jgi:hypothetical protein
MATQLPNRTAATAVFKTGSPNYIDLTAEAAIDGMSGIADKATTDSWADGDTFGALVLRDAENWQIWSGVWVAATGRVSCGALEESMGSIADGNTVKVTLCPTKNTLIDLLTTPPTATIISVAGTTKAVGLSDAGKLIRFTSSSPVTVTPDGGLPVGFHCALAQSNVGLVSVIAASGDVVNAVTTAIPMGGQFTTGYLVKVGSVAWEFYA